jgi:23S rRNA (pseudouridine1915-N3)-methyltransferase
VKIRLVWVGKTQDAWVKAGIEEYAARIRRYAPLEIVEAKEEKGVAPDLMRQREGERILKLLPKGSRVMLLDETGLQLTSAEFAALTGKYRDCSTPELCFVIGGAYGLAPELRKLADSAIALSKMTFTHQMIRPFFLEQLYRAFTILNNENYHH